MALSASYANLTSREHSRAGWDVSATACFGAFLTESGPGVPRGPRFSCLLLHTEHRRMSTWVTRNRKVQIPGAARQPCGLKVEDVPAPDT